MPAAVLGMCLGCGEPSADLCSAQSERLQCPGDGVLSSKQRVPARARRTADAVQPWGIRVFGPPKRESPGSACSAKALMERRERLHVQQRSGPTCLAFGGPLARGCHKDARPPPLFFFTMASTL